MNGVADAALREIRLPAARGELAALRGGTPGGPPLLCLHGWLDNAASFDGLAPLKAQIARDCADARLLFAGMHL